MTALAIVPLAPFAAAALTAAFGNRLPARGGWLTVFGTFIAAAALPFFHGARIDTAIDWFSLGTFHFTLNLCLDGLGWWMATLIAWVSLAVNIYAVRYMAEEDGRARFHAWMAFFVASMLTLVLAGSLLLLFLAWEGVGVASFALIAQRYRESAARRAAVKALLMTRLGDFGLLLGWLLALHLIGTTDITSLLDAVQAGNLPQWAPLLLAMLFLAAAIGKSAQLPLTAWLPDAMNGPTPVSALIHSATMVAAGVYLVLRLFPLFQAAPHALDVVLWVGGVTAVFAAIAATAQAHLKRVLAWSTVSQLGEMFIALGLAAPIAATLHLTTHAAFKACLFLGAGIVERATNAHEFARMGGLYRRLPWAAAAFTIGALSLAGLPPFGGYWSDEKILKAAQAQHSGWAIVLLIVIALAGIYIGRAAMAAFGPWRSANENTWRSWTMRIPMLFLAAGAAGLGWLVEQPVASLLPWPEPHHSSGWWWTASAIAASIAGLSFGAWRVRLGPVPALGDWAGALSQAAHRLAAVVVAATYSLSAVCNRCETGFDRLAYGLTKEAVTVAVDVRDRLEIGFDRLACGFARGTVTAAVGVRLGEDRGVWAGNDCLAWALGEAGARLRPLESGKIFLYSAGVFAWTLVAGITIVLTVWLA